MGNPKRGEVWIINWNPSRGSEQAGLRPAVVIQNDIGNEKATTTIVAAISTSLKIYPMNVLIDPPEGGLDRPCIVRTSQILTVSKDRLGKRLGQLRPDTMDSVNQALKLSLDLR
ncbi:MAG: type II toxin-antitoxin system PemK/MazF family toxin [Pseudomonadota bacterium]